MTRTGWAEMTAQNLLEAPLPHRWAHTQGVATTAQTLSGILGANADLLVAAAWLHDIGYSPPSSPRVHPLDGARYLRDTGHAGELLCRLIAHHSGAIDGAAELGLASDLLTEFPPPPGHSADALTYCDMTTGPDGQPMRVDERIAEILAATAQATSSAPPSPSPRRT